MPAALPTGAACAPTVRACPRTTSPAAQAFFEGDFVPYAVTSDPPSDGLFTGYYEPLLRGSRTQHDQYQTPLYAMPSDPATARVPRAQIRQNGIAAPVICYVDDKIDAFFLQIQGSGRVQLDDGTVIRAAYGGQNGYPYTAVGAYLMGRGEIPREQMSMQAIRAWLLAHPGEADSVIDMDESYVFFVEKPVIDDDRRRRRHRRRAADADGQHRGRSRDPSPWRAGVDRFRGAGSRRRRDGAAASPVRGAGHGRRHQGSGARGRLLGLWPRGRRRRRPHEIARASDRPHSQARRRPAGCACDISAAMSAGARRATTDDERLLFYETLSDVKPLRPVARPPARSRKPPPATKPAKAAKAKPAAKPRTPAPARNEPPEIGGHRAVHLKRGRAEPEARLDLHGMTQDAAHRALLRFLGRARANGARMVLVIPGKSGVLNKQFKRWLAEGAFAPLVSGVSAAHKRHGGAGAFYVLLKRVRMP